MQLLRQIPPFVSNRELQTFCNVCLRFKRTCLPLKRVDLNLSIKQLLLPYTENVHAGNLNKHNKWFAVAHSTQLHIESLIRKCLNTIIKDSIRKIFPSHTWHSTSIDLYGFICDTNVGCSASTVDYSYAHKFHLRDVVVVETTIYLAACCFGKREFI